MQKVLNWLNYLSFYWIILLYGSALYVFFNVGHFPSYGNPDPKDAVHEIILKLFNYTILYLIVVIILNVVVIISTYYNSKKLEIKLSMYLLIFNLITLFVVLVFDPGGFLDWFMD